MRGTYGKLLFCALNQACQGQEADSYYQQHYAGGISVYQFVKNKLERSASQKPGSSGYVKKAVSPKPPTVSRNKVNPKGKVAHNVAVDTAATVEIPFPAEIHGFYRLCSFVDVLEFIEDFIIAGTHNASYIDGKIPLPLHTAASYSGVYSNSGINRSNSNITNPPISPNPAASPLPSNGKKLFRERCFPNYIPPVDQAALDDMAAAQATVNTAAPGDDKKLRGKKDKKDPAPGTSTPTTTGAALGTGKEDKKPIPPEKLPPSNKGGGVGSVRKTK